MGIFGRTTVPASATFALTPLGKEKAEQFGGDPKSRVVIAIEELGPSPVKDIVQETGLRRGQVESIIKQLSRGGYIHMVRGEE